MQFLQLPSVDTARISHTEALIEERIEELSKMSGPQLLETLGVALLEVVLKIALALLIWYVGRWIIRKLKKGMLKIFERRHVDASLQTFFTSLISIVLTIFLIIIVIDIIGLNTTSFLALFASAGLALGVALSGTLQNFAGGVMILLLRPYRVGDYIEAQQQGGTVRSIQLFNTVITTPDNRTILIPNGPISTGIINNSSRQPIRRVEWIIGIAYGEDFGKVKKIIGSILHGDPRIIDSQEHTVVINELAESSVNILVRCWTNNSDFWDVFFDVNAKIYEKLPQEGIEFPYPQMDIRINKVEAQEVVLDNKEKGTV